MCTGQTFMERESSKFESKEDGKANLLSKIIELGRGIVLAGGYSLIPLCGYHC